MTTESVAISSETAAQKYDYVESKFSGPITLSTQADSISYASSKRTVDARFKELKSISLFRMMGKAYFCQVRPVNDTKFQFGNRNFQSFGKFTYKNEEFLQFLRSVVDKSTKAGVPVVYGSNVNFYSWIGVLGVLAVGFVVSLLFGNLLVVGLPGIVLFLMFGLPALQDGPEKVFSDPTLLEEKLRARLMPAK